MENKTYDEIVHIGDIVEINGMRCRVKLVRLIEDRHNCNRDHCRRCENPRDDQYYVEAEPVWGEVERVAREKAEAEEAEAAFQSAHELVVTIGTRKVTNEYRKINGPIDMLDGVTLEYDGVTYKRHAYEYDGQLSGRWMVDAEASGLILHNYKYYRAKA